MLLPKSGCGEQTEGERGGRRRWEGRRNSHSPVRPQLPPFPGSLSGSPDHAGEKTLHLVLPQPPVIPQKSGSARTPLRWNAFGHAHTHTSMHARRGWSSSDILQRTCYSCLSADESALHRPWEREGEGRERGVRGRAGGRRSSEVGWQSQRRQVSDERREREEEHTDGVWVMRASHSCDAPATTSESHVLSILQKLCVRAIDESIKSSAVPQ